MIVRFLGFSILGYMLSILKVDIPRMCRRHVCYEMLYATCLNNKINKYYIQLII
jgi:hypothetical protein